MLDDNFRFVGMGAIKMNEKKRKVAIRVAFICVIAIFLYLFFYFLPDFIYVGEPA